MDYPKSSIAAPAKPRQRQVSATTTALEEPIELPATKMGLETPTLWSFNVAMENHHAINGKIHYTWSFSLAMLNYQGVQVA